MGFVAQACYPHPSQADGEEFCIFLNLDFNDGRGLSILIQPSALPELVWHHAVLDSRRRVFSAPDRKTNPWKAGDIRGKNRGSVTATRKLGISDLVFYAHPLLIVTGEHSWPEEIWGEVLQNMVDVLPYESRQRVSKMYGLGETTSEWFRSVFDLSGFDLGIGPDDFGATVIIPEAAAFRHNCRPNVVWHMDAQTLEFHMYPLREISKGEELTISYISVVAEWEERQNVLKEFYNLSCTCAQCRLPPPERERADNQIRRILDIHDVLANWNTGSNASIEMAEELITLHKLQKLDQDLPEAYCFAAREYNAVGNVRKARQYASLALNKAIYIHGNGWRMAQDAKKLESFPENHWSHQRRLQV
ncbi:hypothetical protein CROQUDRAFT_58652 [Cronartium quercuum f. sp. fusiforme G11]|uniref:SET domain-containing protein n=1 Tax=Cronartium quercuum f. sp. fusiforme G11 TaxID=708437 RepID=A0A9P6NTH2_9BASI|nr:hypothetical protein CROQUDRAFT_58652 [Cronartium quercuum f. sp. fusiforme G11]